MCDPASALAGASLAIGAAQSFSKFGAARQDADSLANYQAQERYNAEVDRNLKYNAIGLRQQEETDAASSALFDNEIRATKARATGDTSAADSGVSGNSVESVARDVFMQQRRIDSATLRNEQMSVRQLQNDKESANMAYISRTNQPAIKQPLMLGLGLEIGAAGVQAYDMYHRYTTTPPDKTLPRK
jgi:hypothetical protein